MSSRNWESPLQSIIENSDWLSTAKTNIKKNARLGKKSTYKPELHFDIIIDGISEGDSIYKVCSVLGISVKTFESWLEVHPELKEAYKLASLAGLSLIEELPLCAPQVNMALLYSRLNFRKIVELKEVENFYSKDPILRIEGLLEAHDRGIISDQSFFNRIKMIQEIIKTKREHKDFELLFGQDGFQDIQKMKASEVKEKLLKFSHDYQQKYRNSYEETPNSI